MFRRRPKISREEALSAKPLRLPDAALVLTDDGGGRLTVQLRPPKWSRWFMRSKPNDNGIGASKKTFEFDAVGVFVWQSCDGRTSVQQIIRRLAERYKLNLREAEVSSLQFMQTLVKKGLIGMKLPESAKKRVNHR
jgi:hypothetical protein